MKMKAKIRWTIEFEYPIGSLSDLEKIQFYLEESHCQHNLLHYLVDQEQEDKCYLCSIGKVELIGIIENDNQ